MSDIAIRVEHLAKMYRIGTKEEQPRSFGQKVRSLTASPFAYLNRIRRPPTEAETLWALQDLSIEVKQGEVIGVIGRNGAGKSTLLKILSRITEPSSGQAVVHGRVGSLLEVGTGFHPELTGRENIYLNGAILGMKRVEIDRKFDEIVEFSGVEKLLDTPVKHYSSGMYVRLAFAVAAHLEPEILLVDEVLAVGDAEFQRKCLGKMGDVTKEGRTILFVSHNMIAVQTLCQRALWLNAGVLKAQGAVSDIVTSYLRSGLAENGTTERVWPEMATAPGNETMRLHRIATQPENGKPGDEISLQTPIRIEIEYWNLLPMVHLHPVLHISNDQGIIAFTTGTDVDFDPVLHVQPPTGLFRSVCHIPGNLLNSGIHRVRLGLVRGIQTANFYLDEAIGFEVVDNNERKFAWYGKEPGVLYPHLPWSIEYLGDGASPRL